MSILLLDVDHFKQINDTHGHVVGDVVLGRIVERCNHAVRATDSLCRYGGEEFLVLLPFTDQDGAVVMGERLRSAVSAAPVVIDQQSITVTISIGVATFKTGESLEALISRADQMLYSAKSAGRNRLMRSQ
jgi:diguanylate cyclase (GGDEF)-like protein